MDPEVRSNCLPKPIAFPSLRARLRLLGRDSQAVRAMVQDAFLALCGWIGVDFIRFMRWGLSGGASAPVAHPAGAEGFLPIAALLSLKHLLATGRVHGVHPAGLFIFIAVLGLGLFVAVTGLAMLAGHWRTSLTGQDYLQLIPEAAGRR